MRLLNFLSSLHFKKIFFPHWLKLKMRRRSIFQATLSVRNDLYSENCLHNLMYTSICAYFIASRSSKVKKFIFLSSFDFSQLLPPFSFLSLHLLISKLSHTLVCRWKKNSPSIFTKIHVFSSSTSQITFSSYEQWH